MIFYVSIVLRLFLIYKDHLFIFTNIFFVILLFFVHIHKVLISEVYIIVWVCNELLIFFTGSKTFVSNVWSICIKIKICNILNREIIPIPTKKVLYHSIKMTLNANETIVIWSNISVTKKRHFGVTGDFFYAKLY